MQDLLKIFCYAIIIAAIGYLRSGDLLWTEAVTFTIAILIAGYIEGRRTKQ